MASSRLIARRARETSATLAPAVRFRNSKSRGDTGTSYRNAACGMTRRRDFSMTRKMQEHMNASSEYRHYGMPHSAAICCQRPGGNLPKKG
jgi:hypothetical protein